MNEEFHKPTYTESKYAMLCKISFSWENGVVTGIVFGRNALGVVHLADIASEFDLYDYAIVADQILGDVTLIVDHQVERFHCTYEVLYTLLKGLKVKLDITDARDEIVRSVVSNTTVDKSSMGCLIGDNRLKSEIAGHLLSDDMFLCVRDILTDASVDQIFLKKHEKALVMKAVIDKCDNFTSSDYDALQAINRYEDLSDFKEYLSGFSVGVLRKIFWGITTTNMYGKNSYGLNRQIRYFVFGGNSNRIYQNLRHTVSKLLI